LTSTHMTLY